MFLHGVVVKKSTKIAKLLHHNQNFQKATANTPLEKPLSLIEHRRRTTLKTGADVIMHVTV
jgi:hypothetical protein